MNILFKFNFENGWGDTFLSIFDIVNCADYIKENHPEIKLFFNINDRHETKVLSEVLNIPFFDFLFDEFRILGKKDCFPYGSNIISYNNTKYYRIYSGRNESMIDNIPGIFDVYVNDTDYEYFKKLNIPFIEFTFDNYDSRPKDFNVFNEDIVAKVNKFIEVNLSGGYESIYYRSVPPINNERIIKFKDILSKNLDYTKKYFLCSNSSFVKEIFYNSGFNISLYRPLESHNANHIPNGLALTKEDSLFAVAELLILSRSNLIHYCGDMSWVSLFNWYSINVKKVKINEVII